MAAIFLKPYFVEKIWGGTKLESMFQYHIPSEKTGEAWLVSTRPDRESLISSSKEFKTQNLSQLYQQSSELFGNPISTELPLLIKIIDANQELSVQVYPRWCYLPNQ